MRPGQIIATIVAEEHSLVVSSKLTGQEVLKHNLWQQTQEIYTFRRENDNSLAENTEYAKWMSSTWLGNRKPAIHWRINNDETLYVRDDGVVKGVPGRVGEYVVER